MEFFLGSQHSEVKVLEKCDKVSRVPCFKFPPLTGLGNAVCLCEAGTPVTHIA